MKNAKQKSAPGKRSKVLMLIAGLLMFALYEAALALIAQDKLKQYRSGN
jgi:hypothetical protein